MKKLIAYVPKEETVKRRPFNWRPSKEVHGLALKLARKMGCSANEAVTAAVMKAAAEEQIAKKFKLRERA